MVRRGLEFGLVLKVPAVVGLVGGVCLRCHDGLDGGS